MKKQQKVFVFVTVFMLLFLCGSMFLFGSRLNQHMQEDVKKRLQDNIEPNIISFKMQMQEQIKKVDTFSDFLGENWGLSKEIHTSLLQAAVEHNGLLRCAIAYPDGSFITHDSKNEGNVSKEAFFIANMKGESFITDPRPAVVDETKKVILFSAPVFDENNQILGSVIYSYLCDDIDKIFNLNSMDGEMNMVVAKEQSTALIGKSKYAADDENLLEALKKRCTHKDHPANQCLQLNGDSGIYFLTSDNGKENLYVRYDKLGFKDWYMISTISESAANAGITFAINNQRSLSGLVATVVFVYLLFIIWQFMRQRKHIDTETGALTLYAFKQQAKKILKIHQNENFVVVKLDVKDFKLINRIHSFAVGDKLIKNMAQALSSVIIKEQGVFSRIGVDVFVLLLPYNGMDNLYEKRQAFIQKFQMLMDEGFSTKIIFPTGQYVLQESDFPKPDLDDILEKVNFAHHAAKQNSDVIIDYSADIESAALFEKTVEDRMESAIHDEEFTLYLQPKVCLKDETLCGAEALARWKINGKYYMYPTDFIPVLEKNGFIVQLDKYMFEQAVRFQRECINSNIPLIPIAVNFSRHHLKNSNFVKEICKIADAYQVPHQYMEIELTESAFLGDISNMTELITSLHEEGFCISMDDFGSGYSCFSQLKDLNIDVLKIDKGFFGRTAEDESRSKVVIEGILKIAQQLNITTVAEGVEYKWQVDMLKMLNCDIVQGYYYSRPIPAGELDVANFEVSSEEAN